MRSLYASQYLVPAEMSWKRFEEKERQRIRPDISSSVTVGTDLRTIWAGATEGQPTRNFFQMQGDLYLEFAADDRFAANLNVDQTGSTEIYGIGWLLPWSGYVKAGRFVPAFGWRFADHNLFTREELGFDQPFNTDAGIEFGVRPGGVAIHAAILNGEPGSNPGWDQNRDVAWLGNALWQFQLASVGVGLGGSFYYNRNEPSATGGDPRTQGSSYGYLNWRRWSWLWEVDASRLGDGMGATTKLVTTHEVGVQLGPGIDVLATYNYADPNLDGKTGRQARYGVGFALRPVPCVDMQAMLNAYRFDEGSEVAGEEFLRGEVQVHLFY